MINTQQPRRTSTRRVLVLGGAGFIGRHVSSELQNQGMTVVIGSRHPQRAGRGLPKSLRGCERRGVRLERCLAPVNWKPHLDAIDGVINCVGILRQRGRETYDRVHHRAPGALAEACRHAGLPLLHVSALGLRQDARSGFIRSKWLGERAVRKAGGNWYLIRPSLLAGDGGFGARWVRWAANWIAHIVPANARGVLAPLQVEDLARAIAHLTLEAMSPHAHPALRVYELGGPQRQTFAEHLVAMRNPESPVPRRLTCPAWLARLASHLFDLLHLTPYSFGHHELLSHRNAPRHNQLPGLLGTTPTPVYFEASTSVSQPACDPRHGVLPQNSYRSEQAPALRPRG